MAHIEQQRTAEIQPQRMLESRVAFDRAVCYLILVVKLCKAGRPISTFDTRFAQGRNYRIRWPILSREGF
jgi:hypothetical protein